MELHTEIALLQNLSLKQYRYLKICFTVKEKIDKGDMASTSSSARDSLCKLKQNINVLLFSILETRSSKYLFSPSPVICLFCLHCGTQKTHRHDLVKTLLLSFISTGVPQDPGHSVTSLLLSSTKRIKPRFKLKKGFFTYARNQISVLRGRKA